jgi:hypothetical protein
MAVTPDQLNQVVSTIQQRYPAFNYISSYDLSVTGAIANSTTSSTFTNCTVTDPSGGTNVPTVISAAQWWVVYDEYISATTTVNQDATTKFVKNGNKILQVTSSLDTNVVSNNTRPGLSKPMVFEPQSQLTLSMAPTATAGTAGPYTNTFHIAIVVLDSSYSNQLSF